MRMVEPERVGAGAAGELLHNRRACLVAGLAAVVGAWAGPVGAASALQGQTLRMAFIDPLSGPIGEIGRNGLKSWQFMAEALAGAQRAPGVRLVVAGFDNKGSPQESLNALKAAIDQGFRVILQGNGSGVAAAISDAVTRHNLRHPQRAVLYINYAAMDPVLTGEKCSHWHVRIDADTVMKTQALARFMAEQPALQRVHLLNQNYAHGQQFSQHFKQALAQWRPDVMVVGDDLHPPFQGRDFTPYVDQMRRSGAQALVTANWGVDLRDLVTSLVRRRMDIPMYAYYPSLPGVPTALAAAQGRFPVYQVACHHSNQPGAIGELAQRFQQSTGENLVIYAAHDGVAMLLQAMARAGSTDPARLAEVLSGLRFQGFDGPVQVRPEDHQLQIGVYLSRWQKVSSAYPVGAEGTGYTFAPVRHFEAAEISGLPACQMRRP